MYFASLRSVGVNPETNNLGQENINQPRHGALVHKSRSLGTLHRGVEQRSRTGEATAEGDTAGGIETVQSEGGRFRIKHGSRAVALRPLSTSKSSTAVRFSGSTEGSDTGEAQERKGNANDVGGEDVVVARASDGGDAEIKGRVSCNEKVSGKMRRGSEMASWAICGTRERSARDYLW